MNLDIILPFVILVAVLIIGAVIVMGISDSSTDDLIRTIKKSKRPNAP